MGLTKLKLRLFYSLIVTLYIEGEGGQEKGTILQVFILKSSLTSESEYFVPIVSSEMKWIKYFCFQEKSVQLSWKILHDKTFIWYFQEYECDSLACCCSGSRV